MQGRSDDQRDLLDVESVAGHLLRRAVCSRSWPENRRELFPDELFADLFPSGRGRPSVPADVMAAVIVLQALHGLSDADTVDELTYDLRWKAACGLPVAAAGSHPTTLTYWRRRLAASQRPNRIFEVVRQVVTQTGVLTGKTRVWAAHSHTDYDKSNRPARTWTARNSSDSTRFVDLSYCRSPFTGAACPTLSASTDTG